VPAWEWDAEQVAGYRKTWASKMETDGVGNYQPHHANFIFAGAGYEDVARLEHHKS